MESRYAKQLVRPQVSRWITTFSRKWEETKTQKKETNKKNKSLKLILKECKKDKKHQEVKPSVGIGRRHLKEASCVEIKKVTVVLKACWSIWKSVRLSAATNIKYNKKEQKKKKKKGKRKKKK